MDNLTQVPKSLRFLYYHNKNQDSYDFCDETNLSDNVEQLLPLRLHSSISNSNRIFQSNRPELQNFNHHSNERSVQTFDIRFTKPNDVFEKFGDRRKSKSLPELRELSYVSKLWANNDNESLTDSESFHSFQSNQITPNWKSKTDFLFTGMALSLGLNNIWRFPYYGYKSESAGSLLLLYIFQMCLCGFPLLCMEYAIGQFKRQGQIRSLGNLCPILKGVGILSTIIVSLMIPLYNMINSWSLLYFFQSFQKLLPWNECTNESVNCFEIYYDLSLMKMRPNSIDSIKNSSFHSNQTLKDETLFSFTISTSDFFHNKLVDNNSEALQIFRWDWLGINIVIWVSVFIGLRKHLSFSSHSNNYMALLPFCGLLVLLLRSITLEGAIHGITHYFRPTWGGICDVQTWIYSAVLCLHSLGTVTGLSLSIATCNKHHNNILRDAYIICFTNLLSIVIIGCVIFGTLGYISYQTDRPIEQILINDPGTPYIIFSHLISSMPLPPLWSLILFATIFCLGTSYQISLVQTLMISIEDAYSSKIKKVFGSHKYFLFGLCIYFPLIGTLFIGKNGLKLIEVVDFYICTVLFLVTALLELILIAWFYGGYNLSKVIKQKTRKSIGTVLPFCWIVLTPILILIIIAYTIHIIINENEFMNQPKVMRQLVRYFAISLLTVIPLVSYFQIMKISESALVNRFLYSCKPKNSQIIKNEEMVQIDNFVPNMTNSLTISDNSVKNDSNHILFTHSAIQGLDRETFI